MDVVVEPTHWHVVVDDHTDVFNIQSPGGNICGNQNICELGSSDWLLELGVYLISLPLLLVSVNSFSIVLNNVLQVFVPMEVFLKGVTHSLGLAEDYNFHG